MPLRDDDIPPYLMDPDPEEDACAMSVPVPVHILVNLERALRIDDWHGASAAEGLLRYLREEGIHPNPPEDRQTHGQ